MTLSIVVPVYNEARVLPKLLARLRSLLEEDGGAEVLLVDGGSDDGSDRIVAAAGFRCLRSRRGRAAQMNLGARAARGQLLLFLHADTELPREALARARAAVADGAVGGYFAVRLDSDRPLLRLVGRMITLRSRLTGVASGDQAIFITREAFEALGGYSPLPLFEDLDLCRRMKRLGPVAALEPPVTTSCRRWRRWGPARTILRMWALRLLYYCGVDPGRLARYYGATR